MPFELATSLTTLAHSVHLPSKSIRPFFTAPIARHEGTRGPYLTLKVHAGGSCERARRPALASRRSSPLSSPADERQTPHPGVRSVRPWPDRSRPEHRDHRIRRSGRSSHKRSHSSHAVCQRSRSLRRKRFQQSGRTGAWMARRTISMPTFWSWLAVARLSSALTAGSSATPPPGWMPSSTAVRVA